MSSSSSTDSTDSIEISDITIRSSTVITSIKLSIGSIFKFQHTPSDKLKEATLSLGPTRPSLLSSTPLIIKVHLEGLFQKKKIEVKYQDLLSIASTVDADTNNRQEHRRTVNGMEVIIGFMPDMRSTTDGIFDMCPRFRVLVIGRTGAGKTSLIVNTFGVTDALISHHTVGECNINKELFSPDENKRFVLHDSKGFEPGDTDNFDTVMEFLNDRKKGHLSRIRFTLFGCVLLYQLIMIGYLKRVLRNFSNGWPRGNLKGYR